MGNRAGTRLAKGSDTFGHESLIFLRESFLSLGIGRVLKSNQCELERYQSGWGQHASSVTKPNGV